jgi:hypothetical protein
MGGQRVIATFNFTVNFAFLDFNLKPVFPSLNRKYIDIPKKSPPNLLSRTPLADILREQAAHLVKLRQVQACELRLEEKGVYILVG